MSFTYNVEGIPERGDTVKETTVSLHLYNGSLWYDVCYEVLMESGKKFLIASGDEISSGIKFSFDDFKDEYGGWTDIPYNVFVNELKKNMLWNV